jgi:hypothetical protein
LKDAQQQLRLQQRLLPLLLLLRQLRPLRQGRGSPWLLLLLVLRLLVVLELKLNPPYLPNLPPELLLLLPLQHLGPLHL